MNVQLPDGLEAPWVELPLIDDWNTDLPSIDVPRLDGAPVGAPDPAAARRTVGEAVDSAAQLLGRAVDAAGHTAGEVIDVAGHTLGVVVELAGRSLGEALDSGSQAIGGMLDASGEHLRVVRGRVRPRPTFGWLRLAAAFGIAAGVVGLIGVAVLLFEPRRGAQRRAALARRLGIGGEGGFRGRLGGSRLRIGDSREPVALHIETSDRPPFEGIGMELHAPDGATADRSDASPVADSSGDNDSAGGGGRPG